MVDIDWYNPDPDNGIFGCFGAVDWYHETERRLLTLYTAISSVSSGIEHLLSTAPELSYLSGRGLSPRLTTLALQSFDSLELIHNRLATFTEDMRANFLRDVRPIKNPISFFISYSHKDSEFVDPFVRDLRAHGHFVWRDKENIRIGNSIRRSIEKGLTGSQFVIAVISASSIKSEWCQKELDMALEDEMLEVIKVLPIVIDDCEIPTIIRSKRYLKMGTSGEVYNAGLQQFLTLLPDQDKQVAVLLE